jgi:hypothetical protein
MTVEIKALHRQLSISPLAAYYWGRATTGLDQKTTPRLVDLLNGGLNHYGEIDTGIEGATDFEQRLASVLTTVPSAVFRLAAVMKQDPDLGPRARMLQYAGILFLLALKHSDTSHLELFLKRADPDDGLEALNREVFEGDGPPSLRRLVLADFMLIARHLLRLKPSTSRREQIEALFCYQGLLQIFLRYHFELIGQAADDNLARHVDTIFSRLFIVLRLEEIRYWKAIENATAVRNRLLTIIDQNLKTMRHPVLKKEVFEAIREHHPMIHDGRARTLTRPAHRRLQTQLTELNGFSVARMALVLNIVYRVHGSEYAVYLLTQLLMKQKAKLLQLQDHLHGLNDKSFDALTKLVGSFCTRFQRTNSAGGDGLAAMKSGPPVIRSQTSNRLSAAKKKLKELEGRKDMMTHDQVTAYLEKWLKNLHERAKKVGALTQDKIPEYLALFTQAAQTVSVVVSPARQRVLVEAFKESTDEILEIIAEHDQLTPEEVAAFKADIHEKVEELDTRDIARRMEMVETIGLTLADASEKAESRPPVVDLEVLLKNTTVMIDFDAMAQSMTLADFMALPLGERKGPDEADWFQQHRRYLELAVEHQRFKAEVFEQLMTVLPQLPQTKYRKYFNVFPGDEYEETVICAVYDIWKSGAIRNIKAA